MNLEALFNAVIVKPIEQNEEMYGSIVVPDMGKDKNEHAVVVAVDQVNIHIWDILLSLILK